MATARDAGTPQNALRRVAHAYSAFATENPALYDAMVTRPTRLPFGDDTTPAQMSAAFVVLREAVAAVAGEGDVDTLTEVMWAGLHGLTTLSRSHRLRPGRDAERIELLVSELYDATSPQPTNTAPVNDEQ